MASDSKLQDTVRLQDDKINKLKSLIIKEKKLNAEQTTRLNKATVDLEATQKESEHFKNQVARLSAQIGELQSVQDSNADEFQETITDAKQELEEVVKKLLEANQRAEEADEKVRIANERAEYIQQTTDQRIKELTSEVEERDDIVGRLRESNRALSCSLKELEVQMEENSSQMSAKIESSSKIIADLESRLGSIQDNACEYSNKEIDSLTELAELQTTCESLKTQIKDYETKIETLSKDLQSVETSSQTKVEELQTMIQEKDKNIEILTSQITGMQTDLHGKTEELETTVEMLDLKSGSCEELRNVLHTKEAEIEQLQNEIGTLSVKLGELESGKIKHADTVDDANSWHEDFSQDMQIEYNRLVQENFELKERITSSKEEMQRQINDLESLIREKETEITQLRESSDQYMDELEDMRRQLELKGQHSVDETELNDLRMRCKSFKSQLEELQDQVTLVEEQAKEIDSLKSHVTEYRSTVEEKDTQLIEMKEEITKLQNSMDELMLAKGERETELTKMKEVQLSVLTFLSELRPFLHEKDSKIHDTQEVVSINDGHLASLLSGVQSLKASRDHLLNTNILIQEGIDCLTRKCSQLEETLAAKDSSLNAGERDGLQQELNARSQALEKLEGAVEDNRNIARALELERDALQTEMMELRARAEEKEAFLVEEAREASAALEEIQARFHGDLETREAEIRSLREERQILQREIDMLQLEIDRKDSELKVAVEKEGLSGSSGEGGEEDWECQRAILAQKTEALEKEQEVSRSLADRLKSADAEIERLKTLLSDLQVKNTSVEAEMKRLEDINLERMAEIQSCNERFKLLTEETNQLKEKLISMESVEAENKTLQFQVKELSDKCNGFSNQLSEANEGNVEKSHEIHIANRKISELTEEQVTTIEELKQLKEENVKLTSDVTDLNQALDEMRNTLQEKENNIVRLTETGNSFEENHGELRQRVDLLTQEMDEAKVVRSELEEKTKKVKQVATKLKKDLQESNDRKVALEKELDEVKDELVHLREEHSVKVETLLKASSDEDKLSDIMEENKNLESHSEELRNTVGKMEVKLSEVEASLSEALSNVTTEKLLKEHATDERHAVEASLAAVRKDHQCELESIQERLSLKDKMIADMKEELDKALRTARQSSMIDLELAEFEKTVVSLKDQVDARESDIVNLKVEIQRRDDQIASLKHQLKETEQQKNQADERGNKLKQLLVKTKRELSELQRAGNDQRTRDDELSARLESLTSELESGKVLLAESAAENHRLVDRLSQSRSSAEAKAMSLESLISNLKGELSAAIDEKDALRAEFDAYKIKAHQTLKERKSRSSLTGVSADEARARSERLEGVVEQLRGRLEETEERLEAAKGDADLMRRECERLEDRQRRSAAETQTRERQWQERLERLSAENSAHEKEHLGSIRHLTKDNEAMQIAHKERVHALKEEHVTSMESLKRQLASTESEVIKLQEEMWTVREQRSQAVHSQLLQARESAPPPVSPWTGNSSLLERQQGEGMEHPVDDEPAVQQPATGTQHKRHTAPVPLDQLLSSPQPQPSTLDTNMDDVASTVSVSSQQTESELRIELTQGQKKIDHLTELLNDSEAMVARLGQQAKVLKEEIRRHERNLERDSRLTGETTEYLKNVIIKFLTLRPGQERSQLVLVLTTLLTLNSEERDIVRKVAEGLPDNSPEAQGWANYFSWSGMS